MLSIFHPSKKIKYNFILLLVFVSSLNVYSQIYTGPVPKPTSGYGTDGTYTVATESFINPNFLTHDIVVYHPAEITSKVPTLFYNHAFGGNDPDNISGFLDFVARKGYAVVFVPYQTVGVTVEERYNNLLQGFIKAARKFPNIIDTTKVGFVGHSFGGGAVFANSLYCFNTLHWGESGRFIFSMAQWYSYNITPNELTTFPDDVKLLSIVYENDSINDQRIANDIFRTINISPENKDYLMVKSDTINDYIYLTDHVVPNNSRFDALDYYAYYRLIDAMCDYVFNGNEAGKNVALGHGSSEQISMPGGMKDLVETLNPAIEHPESIFLYPCDTTLNPRQDYCENTTAITTMQNRPNIEIFPNPAHSSFNVYFPNRTYSVAVFDYLGRKLYSKENVSENIEINTRYFSKGVYLVKVNFDENSVWSKKLIIN